METIRRNSFIGASRNPRGGSFRIGERQGLLGQPNAHVNGSGEDDTGDSISPRQQQLHTNPADDLNQLNDVAGPALQHQEGSTQPDEKGGGEPEELRIGTEERYKDSGELVERIGIDNVSPRSQQSPPQEALPEHVVVGREQDSSRGMVKKKEEEISKPESNPVSSDDAPPPVLGVLSPRRRAGAKGKGDGVKEQNKVFRLSQQQESNTYHTFHQEEKKAIVSRVNVLLRGDRDLLGIIPVDPDSMDIFECVQDGILLW